MRHNCPLSLSLLWIGLLQVSACTAPHDHQGSRAEALLRQADECELKAQLITYNLDAVDAALAAVNASLATGGFGCV